jgi:hypothetical protein
VRKLQVAQRLHSQLSRYRSIRRNLFKYYETVTSVNFNNAVDSQLLAREYNLTFVVSGKNINLLTVTTFTLNTYMSLALYKS